MLKDEFEQFQRRLKTNIIFTINEHTQQTV